MADYAYDSDDDNIIEELNDLSQRAAQEQQEEAERRAYLRAKVYCMLLFFLPNTLLLFEVH